MCREIVFEVLGRSGSFRGMRLSGNSSPLNLCHLLETTRDFG